MIQRTHRAGESQIRYWAGQTAELCQLIDETVLEEHVADIRQAVERLRRDRRVLLVGGKGCGKSSLLSELVGSKVPGTAEWIGSHVRWRYRCRDGDSACSRFLASETLDGLELVDSADCGEKAVAEVLSELVREADAVIAVADARSPEDSPIWNFLSALPPELYSNCLIALTFADTLPAETALGLGKRVQGIGTAKLGVSLRLCLCNPHSAQSMADFSARVQEMLESPQGIRRDIQHLAACTSAAIRRQESILTTRSAVARTDTVFMGNIEQEIDNFLARQLQGADALARTYADIVTATLPQLRQKLRRLLGWWLSPVTILRLELLAAGTETCLYRMLCDALLRLQKDADSQFVISCEAHWKSVRPRMVKTLACEIGDFPDTALRLQLDSLRNRLCQELYEPFMRLRLRHELAKTFNAPSGRMLACLWGICFCLILAGLLGCLGQDLPALGCVAMAFIVWLFGSLGHLMFVRRTLADITTCTDTLSEGMRIALHERMRNFIVSRVSAYRVLYLKPRETIARHAKMLTPLQDRHTHIKIGLNSVRF